MSDYISKSKAVESLKKYKFGAIGNDEEREYTKEMVLVILNGIPTISETEIIRKTVERVLERLEEQRLNEYSARAEYVSGMNGLSKSYCDVRIETLEKAIEIVKEECGISE